MMQIIQNWLSELQAYDLLNALGFVALLVVNLCLLPEKRRLYSAPLARLAPLPSGGHPDSPAEKKRKRTAVAETILLSCVQFFSGMLMNALVGYLQKGSCSYNYFGFAVLAPWIFLLVCFVIRVDPFGHLDLYTPSYAASLVLFKLACFHAGCCGGIRTDRIYRYPMGTMQNFPTQLLEAAVALALFFFLLWYRKRAKPGTMQPIYLILYSGTRFCTEFLRVESPVFLCFRAYHFFCLAGFLIGLAEYFLLTARNGRIPAEITKRVKMGKRGKPRSAAIRR